MTKKFTFRNMPHSAVLEDYANGQLAKIEEFLKNEPSPIYIDFIFEPAKIHAHHRIELIIKSPHYDLISHYEGPEFYDALDTVVDKMYRELLNAKDKRMSDQKMIGRHDEFKKQR